MEKHLGGESEEVTQLKDLSVRGEETWEKKTKGKWGRKKVAWMRM